jgi:hypothetical protein
MAMSTTKSFPPPQAAPSRTHRPIIGGQLLRGLLFGLPTSALVWLITTVLVLAVI